MLLKEKNKHYITATLNAILWIAFIYLIWPLTFPIKIFGLLSITGSVVDWFIAAWPIFLWGLLAQSYCEYSFTKNTKYLPKFFLFEDSGFIEPFKKGIKSSFWAGITEEIAFRWILFIGAIPTLKILNWIFGGCIFDTGLTELLYYILIWIADKTTLGFMHEILYHPAGWVIGAAVISTNAFFRNGHKYQGIFGMINSWFLGMFFFWMTFKFGLLSAIFVHVMYDIIVFTVMAVGCKVRT